MHSASPTFTWNITGGSSSPDEPAFRREDAPTQDRRSEGNLTEGAGAPDARAALDDELRRALHGEAWHGPAVAELLAGVGAREALARPIAGGHTIWELVGHLAVWARVPRERFEARRRMDPPDAENFPAPPAHADEAAWREVVAGLHREVDALRGAIRRQDAADLGGAAHGYDYSASVMMHGVAQHLAYHGGQIALLLKAIRGQP